MPYTTKLLTQDNTEVPYNIKTSQTSGKEKIMDIYVEDRCVGTMKYTERPNCIYIAHVNNWTINDKQPLKNIATLCFEHALKESLALGKKGEINLDSRDASAPVFYKLGFRKMSSAGSQLKEPLHELLYAQSKEKRDEIKTSIQKDLWYEDLVYLASVNLHKKPEAVSFDEAIKYGVYSDDNDKFEQLMKSKSKLTALECGRSDMQAIMYLPQDTIAKKIQEFHLESPEAAPVEQSLPSHKPG